MKRKDLELIAELVPRGIAGARPRLRQRRAAGAPDANIAAAPATASRSPTPTCTPASQRGVNVIQLNLEDGLALFEDRSFDVVLQLDTLQHLRNTEKMLRETARVGRIGIVSFPNFAHWPNRLRVASGRMPVTKTLPYQWYDTPNIRVGTYADFEVLARKNGLAHPRRVRPAGRRGRCGAGPTCAPASRCSNSNVEPPEGDRNDRLRHPGHQRPASRHGVLRHTAGRAQIGRLMAFGDRGHGWAAAMDKPMLCVFKPYDGQPATVGNGVMVGLAVGIARRGRPRPRKALELGGKDEGAPGLRDVGGDGFYAAYFRDLDGNKLDVFCYG